MKSALSELPGHDWRLKNGAESLEKRFEGANPTFASLSFTDHREVDVLVV